VTTKVPAARTAPRKPPTLRMERTFFAAGHQLVAGSDEVGRGSLGGPVSAGVVVVDESVRRIPPGLRDSKLLTPAAREALVPKIRSWAVASAVGHASAAEIDALGILAALRLAGERALAALDVEPCVIVLDGNYDWFCRPPRARHSPRAVAPERVTLRIKADLTCASVAAASVLAKVERDAMMRELARSHPAYSWELNKGYATPEHVAALREVGPCIEHRRSWNLPVDDPQIELDFG
jgi:ribonuclease HII